MRIMSVLRLCPLLLLAAPGLAAAQSIPFLPHIYAGVEGGQGTRGNRHSGAQSGGHDKSADYGAYVGVELPTLPFGYFAVEANVGKSEAETRGVSATATTDFAVRGKADWNWSATARAGLNVIPGLAGYGLAGYGAEKVDLTYSSLSTGRVTGEDRRNLDGLIYGVGARYTFGRNLGARLEYRKRLTDGAYDPEQVMAGLYFRL
jgi:opacity protein-like surface antigen